VGRGGVRDQPERHPRLPQLPRREPGSLEERPGLGRPYFDAAGAASVELEEHGERSPSSTGRERARVAVGEEAALGREQGRAVHGHGA
jgi:hypothetical protein